MKSTDYFRNKVLVKRPYLKPEWIEHILSSPEFTEIQEGGRIRKWGYIDELGKHLRVVVLKDTMKFNYFPDTDTLYIDLAERPSVESEEVSADIVLDMDSDGNIVGIEIEHASKSVDLSNLSFATLPFRSTKSA